VAAAPVPEPSEHDQPPTTVLFKIPAHLGFLPTIRTAVDDVVHEVGGSPACRRDLQLAADEAAAVLIEDALPWTELRLAITHDETDVYVRLVTRRAQPGHRLGIQELTQVLLEGVVESHEVFADGRRGYAILQRARN
jgi:hypothetical protein